MSLTGSVLTSISSDLICPKRFRLKAVNFPSLNPLVAMEDSEIRVAILRRPTMPKIYFMFTAVLLWSFSSQSWSLCDKSDVVQALDATDYSYEHGEDDGDYNFYISDEDETIFMWVEPDGDMSFRKIYSSHTGWDGVDLRSLMLKFKYIAAYVDESDNVTISYDVKTFVDQCPQTLASSIGFFFGLMEEVEGRLLDMVLAVREQLESDQPSSLPTLISI